MRRLLVFQHVAHEPLGTLNPLLKNRGFRIRYVNFQREPHARPDISRYNGVVVLGGPMNVDQTSDYPHLAIEVELLREALAADIPVLGICLGAQLIARALGAQVRPGPTKEIGWYEVRPTLHGRRDPLLASLRPRQHIFQWHGDSFELPPDCELLAESDHCPRQAYRYGDKVYGLQFHLEVDAPMIERWLQVPGNVRELHRLGDPHRAAHIRVQTPYMLPNSMSLSDQVFSAFADLFEFRRRIILPSR